MNEKRTPGEWAERAGIVIVQPDGWRHDGKSTADPVTYREWWRRLSVSGIARRKSGMIRRHDPKLTNIGG